MVYNNIKWSSIRIVFVRIFFSCVFLPQPMCTYTDSGGARNQARGRPNCEKYTFMPELVFDSIQLLKFYRTTLTNSRINLEILSLSYHQIVASYIQQNNPY